MSIRTWCSACFRSVVAFLRLLCIRRRFPEHGLADNPGSPGSSALVPVLDIAIPTRPVRVQLVFVELSPEFGYNLLTARSVSALRDLFPPFLNPYLYVPELNSGNSDWTASARAVRAFRAGFSAKRVLEGKFHLVAKSLSLPWDNNFYVALRTRRHPFGWVTTSYSLYVQHLVVDGQLEAGSVSHAFPTISEVEIYLRGAHRQWPCELNNLL